MQNLLYHLTHLPMVWDFIIPLAIIAIFCAILMFEGEYGKSAKKHFKVVLGKIKPKSTRYDLNVNEQREVL
jgi:hypothetical protein